MTELTPSLGRPTARRAGVALTMAAIAAAAVGGGVYGVTALTGGATTPAVPLPAASGDAHSGPHQIFEGVPTSTGYFAVEHLDKSSGLSSRALSGATHYPSYVSGKNMTVQVTVKIHNRTDRPWVFEARNFSVVSGSTEIAARRTSVGRAEIVPTAYVQDLLSFTVPRDGKQLLLRYSDPGDPKAAIFVDLGKAKASRDPGVPVTPGEDDNHHILGTSTPTRP